MRNSVLSTQSMGRRRQPLPRKRMPVKPTEWLMMQMMSLMQEQNRQQAVLLDAVTRRLDALEVTRTGQTGGAVPAAPPGVAMPAVQHGGCQPSGGISFPSDGKPPFGVNLPVADYKSWQSRLQELLGYRTC